MSNHKIKKESLFYQLQNTNTYCKYFFDNFRKIVLKTLLRIFDIHGDNSILFFEAQALEKKLIYSRFFKEKRKTPEPDKIKHEFETLNMNSETIGVLDFIGDIVRFIIDQRYIKTILCDRILMNYSKSSDFSSLDERSMICNAFILKSQASLDNQTFLGQLIAFITREKINKNLNQDEDEDEDENLPKQLPTLDNKEFELKALTKDLKTSKYLDLRLSKNKEKVKKEFKKQKQNIFKEILKQKSDINLETFSRIFLKESSENRSIPANSIGFKDKTIVVNLTETKRQLTKQTQKKEEIKGMSIIKLIESYSLAVQHKHKITELNAIEIDRIIKILVELKFEIEDLIDKKLGGNSRAFLI